MAALMEKTKACPICRVPIDDEIKGHWPAEYADMDFIVSDFVRRAMPVDEHTFFHSRAAATEKAATVVRLEEKKAGGAQRTTSTARRVTSPITTATAAVVSLTHCYPGMQSVFSL